MSGPRTAWVVYGTVRTNVNYSKKKNLKKIVFFFFFFVFVIDVYIFLDL